MSTHEQLLRIAGVLHFCVLIGSALTPRVLAWRTELANLNSFLRRLMWVYGVFIVLIIAGFGSLTLFHATSIAAGEPFARSFSGFVAFFWFVRLAVQLFVFDTQAFRASRFLTAGYHGLTLVFIYFVAVFGWSAFRNP
jgi:hypothetical protein